MKTHIISTLTGIFTGNHKQNTFCEAVQENAEWLKPLVSEIVQQKTKRKKATKAFAVDLDKMMLDHKVQEKYKKMPEQDIYLTWLKMLDPRIDQSTKEKLCEEFLQRQMASQKNKNQEEIGDELCYMPPILVAPILLYSPIKILFAYYKYQKEYEDISSKICDKYFETTLEFLVNNHKLFSKEALTPFLHKIMSMFKQIAKGFPFSQDKQDFLWHEAIASWEKNSLTKLIADSFDQELKGEYDKFQETLQKIVENPDDKLSLRSQLDALAFEKLLIKSNYQTEILTPIVKKFSEHDIYTLGKIYAAHGLNKFAMFKQHLIELAKDTNAPNHYEFSALFFSNCLKYLENEAKLIAPKIASVLSAEYYAKNSYAFTAIRKEMFAFWINLRPEQISEIVKATLALPKNTHQTPIEHFFFELTYDKMPDSFYDKFAILLAKQLTSDQFIKVYSAAPETIQHKLLAALIADDDKALINLKNLSATYKAGDFSAVFLRNVSKQLKSINPKLCQEAEALKLFLETEVKDDLEGDLHLLAKILANESLTHDERRSELRRLKNLNGMLSDKKTDTCPIVLKMFNSVPEKLWPDLFTYFNAEVIHWSFPRDTILHTDIGPKPEPRKNTWLNFKAEWKDILYGTLVAILADISKKNLRGDVAQWALSSIDQALTKSERYFPGMAENILKEFFLSYAPQSIKVFVALHDKFRDNYNAPTYFSQKGMYEQVASWLPEDSFSRTLFLAHLLKFDNRFEPALRIPFIRNTREIADIALILVNTRTEHIVNFIKKFSGDIAVLFKNMYQFDKQGLLTLMQTAFSDLAEAKLPQENKLQLAIMLLSLGKQIKMDIFKIINDDTNKDFLLKTLLNNTEHHSFFSTPYKLIYSIVNHYKPEELQNLIIKNIQSSFEKDDLLSLGYCIKAALKITGGQFKLPEEIKKTLVDYLTQKIPQMMYPTQSEIELMAHFIPNFDKLFLTLKAKEIMVQTHLSSTQKEYLDDLVRVYGFSSINETCLNLKLVECSAYLVEKFSKFPDILKQIDKAINFYRHFFEEHRHEINWITIDSFNRNLSLVITEAAKISNTIPIDVDIAEVCKKSEIPQELAALMPHLKVMPQTVLSWTNIWSKSGATNLQSSPVNASSEDCQVNKMTCH